TRARRPVRRALVVGVPVTAAVLTAVVAFNATAGSNADGRAALVEAPVVTVEPASAEPVAATVRQIAAAASAGRLPEPGPGQYVYVKSQVSYVVTSHDVDRNDARTWVQPLHTREVWKSPDGTKGWLDEPGEQPKGGITLDRDHPLSRPRNGQDVPGRAPDFSYDWLEQQNPDPDALLRSVHAAVGEGPERDQRAFREIGSILHEQLVPAPVAAALYQAAAKIPGVVVVPHSQDAAGRDGIALARLDERHGDRTEWVFDRSTYAYLGSRGVQVREQDGIKAGTVVERTAVLERAVVDAQKQRPGGAPDAA
ncbi:CU044_5270 family protein, partial [Streptomyces sp. WAC06614]|uniref:CU044_5270 family protein n=1 Tax=Streptomyces sp. WAC06614 TaxID=2487416 RepID=UPI00163CCBA6